MRFSDFYKHIEVMANPPVLFDDLVTLVTTRHGGVGTVKVYAVDYKVPTGQAYYRMIDMDRSSPYDEEYGDVEIPYCTSLDEDPSQRRYALTKELMHVFDYGEQLVDTREKFIKLLKEIQNKPMAGPSPALQSEYDTRWMAVLALCPKHLRSLRLEQYKNGEIEDFDIAEEFRIPEWIVPFAMDDYYDEAYNLLMNGHSTDQ